MAKDFSKLQRDRHPMPSFVKEALEKNKLIREYHERPAYQQNDYIGWINQAKQEATKQKRLSQMLAELKEGGVYMKWLTQHLPNNNNLAMYKYRIISQYTTRFGVGY